METKRCSRCGEEKPLSEFHKHKISKDGHRNVCKTCRSIEARRKPIPPAGYKICSKCKQTLPATGEFFNRTPDSKDGFGSWCKTCRKAFYETKREQYLSQRRAHWNVNRDEINAKRREDYKNDPEKVLRRNRAWNKSHPERARVQHQKYYQANRERILKQVAEYTQANREVILAYKRDYYHKNRERLRREAKIRIKNHPEKLVAGRKRWIENNPEKYLQMCRVKSHRRRARQRNLPAAFTIADWQLALDYWGHRCAICGCKEGENGRILAADHWIALSNPTPNNPGTVPENILPLCHGGTRSCNETKYNHDPVEFLVEMLGEEAAAQKLAKIETYFEFVKSLKLKE